MNKMNERHTYGECAQDGKLTRRQDWRPKEDKRCACGVVREAVR